MSKKTKPAEWHPKLGEHYLVASLPGVKWKKKNRRRPIQVIISGIDGARRNATVEVNPHDCDELGFESMTGTVGWARLKRAKDK